jgi:hypothetical protein
VEVAEAYADGRTTKKQLRLAHARAKRAAGNHVYDVLNMAEIASSGDIGLNGWIAATAANHAPEGSMAPYCELLRCIYGDPFHPLQACRKAGNWRQGAVWDLAMVIDQTGDFTTLPVLGDAFEEAGYDAPEVLKHCRKIGPHVRGCWVIDLILDRQ